jgi:PAS domain S-box-containing protein
LDDVTAIAEWIGIGPQRVLEDAPSSAVVIRDDGRIAYANRSAVTLFGYSRAELVGRSIDMLLPEDRRDKHASYIAGWAPNI